MARGDEGSSWPSTGTSSGKKRPRATTAPDDEEEEEEEQPPAEQYLLEAQALIEGENPEDVERVVALLERCIAAAAAAAAAPGVADDEEDEEEQEKDEEALNSPVVPSLAHTWLAKIREQQQQEQDDEVEGGGPVDDAGGPAQADAVAHYEAALACWSENAAAAYALARLRRPRVTTEEGLQEYERLLRAAVEHAPEEDEETRRSAVEDLALLLLQRGESQEADALLSGLGFTHRLATAVLRYTLNAALPTTAALGTDATPFLHVYDDALSPSALAAMQKALAPTAPFWREHGYWRQDQGYFSYLLNLHDGGSEPRLGIEAVIRKALLPLAVRAFPEVAHATTAEWWAHCRRHSSAHQLHYDSLDEGRGFVQHPIASCVLYLTGNGIGGPTLMTDQTLAGKGNSRGLAKQGWFCHARVNRVCVFKADYLHGVVPGRGLPPAIDDTDDPRRITFMVGFWKTRVKPKPLGADGRPGASMDLAPLLAIGAGGKVPAWVAQGKGLLERVEGEESLVGAGVREGEGGVEGPLPCVWERLSGSEKGDRDREEGEEAPPPLYDQCFQGF